MYSGARAFFTVSHHIPFALTQTQGKLEKSQTKEIERSYVTRRLSLQRSLNWLLLSLLGALTDCRLGTLFAPLPQCFLISFYVV